MKKILLIATLLMIAAFMASCSTAPLSNKPKHITLARYRVGNVIQFPGESYQDCTAKIINIIDDNSESYYYQVVISCANEKITKIVPQYYLDNQKEAE